jgi:hypothetical protein
MPKDLPPARIIGDADPGIQDRIRAWKKEKDPTVSLADLILDAFEEIPPADERAHRADIWVKTPDGKRPALPECHRVDDRGRPFYDYTTRVLREEKHETL